MRRVLKNAFLFASCLKVLGCSSGDGSKESTAVGGGQYGTGGSGTSGTGTTIASGNNPTETGGTSSGSVGKIESGTTTTGGVTTGGGATGGGATGTGVVTGLGGNTVGGTPSINLGGSTSVVDEVYVKPTTTPPAEDGSELWLRYRPVSIPGRLAEYQIAMNHVVAAGTSATLQAAQSELTKGLTGLTGKTVTVSAQPTGDGAVVLGTLTSSTIVKDLPLASRLTTVGTEGYVVEATVIDGKKTIVIAANTDVGVLRGSFATTTLAMPSHC